MRGPVLALTHDLTHLDTNSLTANRVDAG